MPIWRHTHETEYTVLPNSLIRDPRLSPKDVGLLCYMLSLPPDWDFSIRGLEAIMERCGKAAIATSVRNLEKHGYLRKNLIHQYGKIQGFEWEVTDIPNCFQATRLPYPDFQDTVYQDTGFQDTDNQPQTKYISNKVNKKQTKESVLPFQAPSVQEVTDYCFQHSLNVNAERFVDYYSSVGWKVGKQPMADWKAAVRNWNREERKENTIGTYHDPILCGVGKEL